MEKRQKIEEIIVDFDAEKLREVLNLDEEWRIAWVKPIQEGHKRIGFKVVMRRDLKDE